MLTSFTSLTIFLVAIVDWYLNGEPLSMAAIIGGLLIMAAFLLLSWSTYREMDEERRKRLVLIFLFNPLHFELLWLVISALGKRILKCSPCSLEIVVVDSDSES